MSKTLIVRYSQIGDVLIAVPVIYSMLKRYPEEQFTILTNEKFKGIFKQMPPNLTLMPMIYRKKKIPLRGLVYLFDRYLLLLKIFFSGKYDKVALLQNGTFENQLSGLLSLRGSKVVKINLKNFLSTERLLARKCDYSNSLSKLFMKTLGELGFLHLENEFNCSFYKDSSRQEAILKANKIPTDRVLIGFAPFSRIPAKMYSLEKMLKVISHFHSLPNVQVVIFGGGDYEKEKTDAWKEQYPNLISLIGKLSFDDEMIVIASCKVMISMDSANLHLSALVDTPVVSVWGPSHPGMGYYPYNVPKENVIDQELDCRPCSYWGEKPCKNDKVFECMNLSPELIINKINIFLV